MSEKILVPALGEGYGYHLIANSDPPSLTVYKQYNHTLPAGAVWG